MVNFWTGIEWCANAVRPAMCSAVVCAGLLGSVLPGITVVHADEPEIDYHVYRGQNGPANLANGFLATTDEEWNALWAVVDQKPPRPLNEGEETGVALFMGERPTGGYDYRVMSITLEDDRLNIRVRSELPGEVATQVITAPYMFLIVEAVAKETDLAVRTLLGPAPGSLEAYKVE